MILLGLREILLIINIYTYFFLELKMLSHSLSRLFLKTVPLEVGQEAIFILALQMAKRGTE